MLIYLLEHDIMVAESKAGKYHLTHQMIAPLMLKDMTTKIGIGIFIKECTYLVYREF
jgi:hypothetical protein